MSNPNPHEKAFTGGGISHTKVIVPILTYQLKASGSKEATNYPLWRKKMQAYLESTYPDDGTFISNGSYWNPVRPIMRRPVPTVTLVAGASDEDILANDEANKLIEEINAFEEILSTQMIRAYANQVEDSRKDKINMFNDIWNTLSDASKAILQTIEDFEKDVEKKKDAFVLWESIHTTHSSINSGIQILDTLNCGKDLYCLKMFEKESTLNYKERLLRLLEVNKNHNGPDISEELATAMYFNGLDHRFLSFQQGVQNIGLFANGGGKTEFPKEIEVMYHLSNSYKILANNVVHQSMGGIDSNSIFPVTHNKKNKKPSGSTTDAVPSSTTASNGSNNNLKGDKRSFVRNSKGEIISPKTGKVVICYNCKENHYQTDCPILKVEIAKSFVGVIYMRVLSELDRKDIEPNFDLQLLDTGCARDLQMCNNKFIVNNIRVIDPPVEIGVGGKLIKINQVCDTEHFGPAYFSELLPFTIWSFDQVTNFCKCEMVNQKTFRVHLGIGNSIENINGESVLDFHCDPEFNGILIHRSILFNKHIYVPTVRNNMLGYTVSEINRAHLVQEFIQQQAFISIKNLRAIPLQDQ